MKKSISEGEIAGRRAPSRLGMLMSPIKSFRKNRESSHPEITADYYSYRRAEAVPLEAERRSASAVGAWQRQSFNR
ncbi:MAG TPA: hypothetical protein VJ574_02875 [Candidatus Bathyarchaeia archaeon]|nr:hypothetical protein [Candidatus Bathyarchaeia archaeon]